MGPLLYEMLRSTKKVMKVDPVVVLAPLRFDIWEMLQLENLKGILQSVRDSHHLHTSV